MNTDTGPRAPRRRSRFRRPGNLPAALAGIALLAAGCGGTGSPAGAGDTAYQRALAYAQCMRSHGEPGFPDPNGNGIFAVSPKQASQVVTGPVEQACRDLAPRIGALPPARQRLLVAQALRFTACMRSHGAPDFPDPTVNSQGISFRPPPGGSADSAPLVRSARQACRKLLPAP